MILNLYFLIVLLIASIAFIGDIIIYLLNLSYGISIIISTILVFIILYFSIKNKKLKVTLDFEKTDIYLFIVMFFVSIITGIVYPDYTYDTISYHSYLQENPFIDKVNFDFFPGRIFCMFLFPLGDRMYYIIRVLFGYRFGAMLSFFSPIVLFYQTKKILKILTNKSKICSMASYFIFLITSYSIFIGTYYIDCLCIIFTLQILVSIYENNDIFKNKYKLYFLGLISGIAIAIKITQIFFIIPLYLFLIYKNRKDLKEIHFKNIVVFGILNVLPCIVYMLDNYIQTGSILFPYYNAIFKSEYFGNYNWVDERFGIDGIISKIFWPLKKISANKYGDELVYIDIFFSLYFIGTICYFIYALIKHKRNEIFELTILALILDFMWIEFLEGYFRYGSFVGIVFGIINLSIIVRYIDLKLNGRKCFQSDVYKVSIIIVIFILIVWLITSCDFKNGTKIFKDKNNPEFEITIDGVWGASYDCVGIISLVRKDNTPIYNLHREYFESSEKALNLWEDKINNNEIYTIIDWYGENLEDNLRVKNLNHDGFEIDSIVKRYTADEIPYINTNGEWLLVKLKYVN